MTQCEKFGDVEDFELHIDTEDPNETDDEKKTTLSGNCVVHFCSIDSAIRTYESYLRRIQHDVQRDADTEATEEEDADEDKDKTDVNKKYSIKFIKAKFGKDRCDRTEIETIKNDQESTEESTTPIEGPLNSSTELKSFITSPEIERTPNGLNIADPISPNSSDIEASPLKSPLTNPENDLESTALSNVDYSIGSSSSRFPNNPAFVPVPYVLSNPLMSHSNASLISTHSCDGSSYGNRSIYLGNLHPKTTVEEIANNVRAGGLVESINYHPDRRVCFITFIDANVAYKFYMNHQVLHQLVIHGYDVTVGWAKQQVGQLNRDIALAVTAGASRNVYIGIKETDSKMPIPIEDELRQDFSNFGSLEQINFIHNKECGFMNFLHIIDAIRVVSIFEQGPTEAIGRLKKVFPLPDEAERFYNKYKDYKISFAKDRCGNSPKFSFKKRLPEHHYEHNHHHHHNNYEENGSGATKNGSQRETDEFNKETIADETAMVFGIVSQTDANKSTELVDVPEVNEDEDDEKTLEEKELEVQKDEAMEAKDEGKDDVEEEEDDDDDEEEEEEEEVSIIIGSDETTSTTQKKPYHHPYRPRPRYQKIYHSNHSEPSFRRSSSNLSLNSSIPFNQSTGQYPHPVYYLPHLSRTNSATSFRSYGNHHQPQQPQQVQPTTTYLIPQTAPPLQYYGNAVVPQQVPPPPPPPNSASASATPQIRYVPIMPLQVPPPPGSTPYISSGSQVMAQYLAKSQQDHQMMYGMTPTPMPMTMPMYPAMNVDESFNDAYSYTSSRRSAGPYRRGSFKK
ncbi:NAB6 RNA-binding protein NAB6 [Candida maltosa Xu316]